MSWAAGSSDFITVYAHEDIITCNKSKSRIAVIIEFQAKAFPRISQTDRTDRVIQDFGAFDEHFARRYYLMIFKIEKQMVWKGWKTVTWNLSVHNQNAGTLKRSTLPDWTKERSTKAEKPYSDLSCEAKSEKWTHLLTPDQDIFICVSKPVRCRHWAANKIFRIELIESYSPAVIVRSLREFPCDSEPANCKQAIRQSYRLHA